MNHQSSISREGAPPRPAAGEGPARLSLEAMAGLWTLRFGLFGCRDDETYGGILHIEDDRMAGGDGYFIFHGHFTPQNGAIEVSAQCVRHTSGSTYEAIFGQIDPVSSVNFRAEAITPDLFEGRLRSPGAPDMRIIMRRFEPLTPRSRIV